LSRGDSVVGTEWIAEDDTRHLWVASSNGQIKRSPLNDYPRKGRATGGVATMQLPGKASVIRAWVLGPGEDVLLISAAGHTARVVADGLPIVGRDRKGVTGMRLEGDDALARMVVLFG
jgi:DNA gyrase subunit A